MTIWKYALLRGMRSYLSLALNLVMPFALIFVRPLWVGDVPMGPFLLAMLLMYGSFLMARGIVTDRLDGTLIRILAGPVTTLSYLAQNLLAYMLPLTLQIAAVCGIGRGLYDWRWIDTGMLALCYIIFAAASVSFSFAWSCLFKNKELSYSIYSVMMCVVAMMSGFWFPLEFIPNALRYIAALFPAYWASNGISALLAAGAAGATGATGATGEYWLSLAAIASFAVAYLLYGGKRVLS